MTHRNVLILITILGQFRAITALTSVFYKTSHFTNC